MNNRTEILMSTYKPMLAIVAYASNTNGMSSEYYLESHTINESGALLEGKPLLQETIQEMVDVFFDERKNMAQIKGIIPDNLLSYEPLPGGNSRMVWYRPAEIRVVHFSAQLKISTGKVWVPAMLYVTEKNSLDVWALKSNTRPNAGTKLFKAPFFNVSDRGDVCLGSAQVAKPKDKTYENLMKYWEDLFWLSEFTHLNDSNKTKRDLTEVWKELVASKTKLKWSDLNELMPASNKLTLKSIIK